MLKVVFIGDTELGASLLQGIIESRHKLVGVINRIEKSGFNAIKQNIKDILYPDNTNQLINAHNIPVLSVKGANSKEFRVKVKELAPDIILMGSWGEILKKETIVLPKKMCINCHPSLLPKHRGGNPFSSVIRYGEVKTGVTFHVVNEKIDDGDILLQQEIDICDNDTPVSLKAKCCYKAKELVKELLDNIEMDAITPIKQNSEDASYYKCIKPEDGEIDWSKTAREIYNQIRGLQSFIPCYARYNNNLLKINSAQVFKLDIPVTQPGKILGKFGNQLLVSTRSPDEALLVEIADSVKVLGMLNRIRSHRFIDKEVAIGELLAV